MPQISIVLAVYEPRIDWLEKLLISIKEQTFRDYELLIRDDASSQVTYNKIEKLVDCVFGQNTRISMYRNLQNQGSNLVFEQLSKDAKGEYIAFCDQDDIWKANKLESLLNTIRQTSSVMAYSDMSIIDENDDEIASSLKQYRKGLRFQSGKNRTAWYVMENCTAGCSMLVKRTVILQACPFFSETVCDQWIAIYASASGNIAFVEEPLVKYRRHNNNQTNSLGGIASKQDYYELRILPSYSIVLELRKRDLHFQCEHEIYKFACARMEKKIFRILKYSKFSPKYAWFDVIVNTIPFSLITKILFQQ